LSNLEQVKKETMLQVSSNWVKQLSAFANASNLTFDKYQQEIVVNTVRKIQEAGLDISSYERNNVADVLYQTSFLRLNPSAVPRHCYFMERAIYENGKRVGQKIEMNIEGEGNDEILRNFGVGIKKDQNGNAVGVHKVWIIREDDEFQEGYYNGLNYQPPMWKPKNRKIGEKKGRIQKVVYPIEKTDGTVEYWSADREDLQPILLKHIEQNLSQYKKADKVGYDKLMNEVKQLTFDEIIAKYGEQEVKYTYYGKSSSSNVIQDSYSGVTGEAMIIRKLRNVALRTYPKNFDKTLVEKIYESTFEEKYSEPKSVFAETKLAIETQEVAGSVKVDVLDKEVPKTVIKQTQPKPTIEENAQVEIEVVVEEPKIEVVEKKVVKQEEVKVVSLNDDLESFTLDD
jgi:hypothetical protein